MFETKRLQVRPLSLEELKRHIEFPVCFAQELGFTPSSSLIDKETQEAISNDLLPKLSDPSKDPLFYTMWILVEKSKKAIIGGICFHGEPDESGEVEIGYGIDEGYQNQGYMTETIAGIIGFTKNMAHVKAIKAETECSNVSSIKVLEKNGFQIVSNNGEMVILKLWLD